MILFGSIINFVLETSSYFRVIDENSNITNYTELENLSRQKREEVTQVHYVLRSIEIFCNAFFTAELILKFLSAPDKLHFLREPYTIIEFLSIFPIFFPSSGKNLASTLHNYLEVCYILRILRIFVLAPKFSGLRVLLLTLKVGVGDLMLYLMLLLLALLIFATFEFYAEQVFESEKNQFESILLSLWWAVVTITTLGYGDIVPSTALGRIIGALCALCGLVFLALPIPVIVNNFTIFYAQAKGYQRLLTVLKEHETIEELVKLLELASIPVRKFIS